jgi:acetyltransferase-like isoleucine patch superfamily enzyme
VVTKSITEKGVWAGNPAKLLRRLPQKIARTLGAAFGAH